jgi:hypothetical protein
MREVGLVIYAGYQPTGFAVTSPFEIARERSGRRGHFVENSARHFDNVGARRFEKPGPIQRTSINRIIVLVRAYQDVRIGTPPRADASAPCPLGYVGRVRRPAARCARPVRASQGAYTGCMRYSAMVGDEPAHTR